MSQTSTSAPFTIVAAGASFRVVRDGAGGLQTECGLTVVPQPDGHYLLVQLGLLAVRSAALPPTPAEADDEEPPPARSSDQRGPHFWMRAASQHRQTGTRARRA